MVKQADAIWGGLIGRAAFVGAFVLFGGVWQAAMAQPSGADGGDFIYRVQQGDTINSIARKRGASIQAILKANPSLKPGQLRIGQQVLIPKK